MIGFVVATVFADVTFVATYYLSLVQAAKTRKASRIFAIDLNESKFALAKELGATDCINPAASETPIQQVRSKHATVYRKPVFFYTLSLVLALVCWF